TDDRCRPSKWGSLMTLPKGSLTAAQYEIMDAAWPAAKEGITVAEMWQRISESRSIGRTTVLNQVDRLEKRGWLKRLPGDGPTRFRATLAQEDGAPPRLGAAVC